MIKQCEYCETELIGFPYKCKYCSNIYCFKHRLPENLDCMFSSSKRVIPQKLEVGGTYYRDSDVSKRPQKDKKVKQKKNKRKVKIVESTPLF